MALLGIFLIGFGLVDVLGSWGGFDLWRGAIGWRSMPDALWQFSGYVELGIGYMLLQMGGGGDEAEEAPAESEVGGEEET